MPTALSCKSASALDSLPRHTNAKRSSTALNRLQQRKQQAEQPPQNAEFGILAPKAAFNQKTGGLIKRSSTKHRRGKGPGQGLASSDLPLASSDLYSDEENSHSPTRFQSRGAFSDGEQGTFSDVDDGNDGKGIRLLGRGIRAKSVSPVKASRPMRLMDVDSSSPSSPAPSSPTRRFAGPMPARKRMVTKAMIGTPTNFQHTGHIGAASYGALQQAGDAEQLQRQLSEVAAALKMDDMFVSAPVSSRLPTREASKESDISTLTPSSLACDLMVSDDLMKKRKATMADAHVSLLFEPTATELPASPSKATVEPKRTTSKRKPVPTPRKLAALYSEFNEGMKEEGSVVPLSSSAASEASPSFVPEDEEEEDSVAHSLPTIRAQDGKRLVQGPAGDYITDTANGRWNVALDEITKALKADGSEVDADDEDIQDGLRQADEILGRLDAL
ncbi:hypothetical protein CBS101457_001835 [Exobasidium rhododendri]|nr:hypothetical protein CBS101457_001835 [Exobasidium rhododendri]